MNVLRKMYYRLFQKKETKTTIDYLREQGVTIGEDCGIWDCRFDLSIPEFIKIGNHTTITCSRILVHDSTTLKQLGYRKIGKVTIGDWVFVSSGCVILPGTYIPNKVIIGARCTIKGILEENSLYIANEHGMATKVGTYDEYMEKHLRNIKKNQFVWEKPIKQMDHEEKKALAESLPEGKQGYIKTQ